MIARTAFTLTGTATIVRLILRRDRVRTPVWLVAIAGLVALTVSSVQGLYPTAADLQAAGAFIASNPTARALNGPAHAVGTLGGRVAFELGAFTYVVVALMSLFMVSRHTRAEEESGRVDLLRAGVLGRHATTTAALLVVTGTNLVLGAVVAAILIGMGLPVTGSIVLASALAAGGIVFGAVTAVTAQITEHSRAVSGIAATVLGIAFVLRAAGDVGDGTLSWLSPIGWGQASRPYADERWWPLLLALGFAVALAVIAFAAAARRDVGAGLVRPGPGPARASSGLARPVGLALRLQRGSLIGWSVGLFLLGAAYGSVGNDVAGFIGSNEDLADMLAVAGGDSLTDSFFATAFFVIAVIGSGFAVQSILRLHGEESGGRAEPLLATPVARWRWAGSHLVVALAGSAVVLAAAGLGAGFAFGAATGEPVEVARMLGAALVYAPALWVLIGVGAALFGFASRAAALVWAVLAGCILVGLLGPLLQLPEWLMDLSPFQHVPQLPVAEPAPVPLLALTLVAAGSIAVGLAALRRRDIG